MSREHTFGPLLMQLCVSQVSEISVEGEMCGDIETRFKQIQTRLKAVTEETEEVKGIKPSLILVFTCLYLLWVLTTVNLCAFGFGSAVSSLLEM